MVAIPSHFNWCAGESSCMTTIAAGTTKTNMPRTHIRNASDNLIAQWREAENPASIWLLAKRARTAQETAPTQTASLLDPINLSDLVPAQMKSSGESLPTPMSAILLEAVIIGEFAYGTTVASDSSLSVINPPKITDRERADSRLPHETRQLTFDLLEPGRSHWRRCERC